MNTAAELCTAPEVLRAGTALAAVRERDELEAEVVGDGVEVLVEGTGAEGVPRDATHLVVRAMQVAFDEGYVTAEEKLQTEQAVRGNKLNDLQTSIVTVRTKAGGVSNEERTAPPSEDQLDDFGKASFDALLVARDAGHAHIVLAQRAVPRRRTDVLSTSAFALRALTEACPR